MPPPVPQSQAHGTQDAPAGQSGQLQTQVELSRGVQMPQSVCSTGQGAGRYTQSMSAPAQLARSVCDEQALVELVPLELLVAVLVPSQIGPQLAPATQGGCTDRQPFAVSARQLATSGCIEHGSPLLTVPPLPLALAAPPLAHAQAYAGHGSFGAHTGPAHTQVPGFVQPGPPVSQSHLHGAQSCPGSQAGQAHVHAPPPPIPPPG